LTGATATCDGTKCALKCNAGLYMCNGICQQCCENSQCGSGKACANGTCVAACASNVACTQGIGPCRSGKTFCASPTSQAECRDSGVDDSRNTCGGGNICSGGQCVAPCKGGGACTQNIGACRAGKYVCASPTSQPECKDSGADDNRQTCGGGLTCSGGTCVTACQGGGSCPAGPCQSGSWVCDSPTSTRRCATKADDNQGGCPGGQKCSGGRCVSACTPTNNPCNGHGTCQSGGTCACRDPWIQSGSTCVDPCAGINCGAHGNCVGGSCKCTDNYSGNRCQTAPDPCANCTGFDVTCGSVRCGFPKGHRCAPGSDQCGNGACKQIFECNCIPPGGDNGPVAVCKQNGDSCIVSGVSGVCQNCQLTTACP
jgi:hypothetical protein